MISAKEAVEFAKKYLIELDTEQSLKSLALEAISHSEDDSKPYWNITLGYHQKRDIDAYTSAASNSGLGFGGSSGQAVVKLIENRIYKNLKIDSNSGQLISISSHFAELR